MPKQSSISTKLVIDIFVSLVALWVTQLPEEHPALSTPKRVSCRKSTAYARYNMLTNQ
jgi:hypothetical protein